MIQLIFMFDLNLILKNLIVEWMHFSYCFSKLLTNRQGRYDAKYLLNVSLTMTCERTECRMSLLVEIILHQNVDILFWLINYILQLCLWFS